MNINTVLIIIQRSNGDVLLSSSLISQIQKQLKPSAIDLLVNDDTISIAKTISMIRNIHTFSYSLKNKSRWNQESSIIKKIYRKYDLCINLTSSDRSVLYALFASKNTISAIERSFKKSWWKKIFLKNWYYFDSQKHIFINNLQPLKFLGISPIKKQTAPIASLKSFKSIEGKLKKLNIFDPFLIFHPSAQYDYKIFPEVSRNKLLYLLSQLDMPIIVTGGNSEIDINIKKNMPLLPNIFNLIGNTSIDEYIALSQMSNAYVGMDTLNMHIAACQEKPIFAIFGPTNLKMWSPWSNELESSAFEDKPIQTYGKTTIFQADMPCVACGKAGCDDKHGNSDCLDNIDPAVVFKSIEKWCKSERIIDAKSML
tara:strand:+ start:1010 stop:2116 length:1107 start_codon:yes stop_codon:yes gene_type:complete